MHKQVTPLFHYSLYHSIHYSHLR